MYLFLASCMSHPSKLVAVVFIYKPGSGICVMSAIIRETRTFKINISMFIITLHILLRSNTFYWRSQRKTFNIGRRCKLATVNF